MVRIMDINSIEWHENNLKNMRLNTLREKEYLEKEIKKQTELENTLKVYEFQVSEAKKEGKIRFDRMKYKITKVKP